MAIARYVTMSLFWLDNSNEMGDDLLIKSSHSSASPGGCQWCSILQSLLVGGQQTTNKQKTLNNSGTVRKIEKLTEWEIQED